MATAMGKREGGQVEYEVTGGRKKGKEGARGTLHLQVLSEVGNI